MDPETGSITALGKGSAKITASFGTLKVSSTVKVRPPKQTKKEVTVKTGAKLRLFLGSVDTMNQVSWYIADADDDSEGGKLTLSECKNSKGAKTGKADAVGVTAGDVTVVCTVDGVPYYTVVHVQMPVISRKTAKLKVGETMKLSLRQTNLASTSIVWESDDESVARVNPGTGVVSAVSPGTAHIFSRTGGADKDESNKCEVTVVY